MEEHKKYPSLSEVKAAVEKHDILTGCSLSYHSSGMMFNSTSSDYISVDLKDGEVKITHTVKLPFQEEKTTIYRATTDVLGEVRKLVDRENMAAWDKLKYFQEYVVLDQSSSSGMSLYFDDRSLGGKPYEIKHINLDAVRQQGAGNVEKEYSSILHDAINAAKVIEIKESENPNGTMFMGMGMMSEGPAPGCWKCPECNYNKNEGKFCTECGRKKPE